MAAGETHRMLLAGFLAVFAASRPYEEQWLNVRERLARVVDGATLFMGLALFLNATNRTDARSNALAVVVSLCIVGMNVWFVVRVVRVLRAPSSYRVAAGRCVRRAYERARKRMSSVMRRGEEHKVAGENPYRVDPVSIAANETVTSHANSMRRGVEMTPVASVVPSPRGRLE